MKLHCGRVFHNRHIFQHWHFAAHGEDSLCQLINPHQQHVHTSYWIMCMHATYFYMSFITHDMSCIVLCINNKQNVLFYIQKCISMYIASKMAMQCAWRLLSFYPPSHFVRYWYLHNTCKSNKKMWTLLLSLFNPLRSKRQKNQRIYRVGNVGNSHIRSAFKCCQACNITTRSETFLLLSAHLEFII